jgi:hypothetical protein
MPFPEQILTEVFRKPCSFGHPYSHLQFNLLQLFLSKVRRAAFNLLVRLTHPDDKYQHTVSFKKRSGGRTDSFYGPKLVVIT